MAKLVAAADSTEINALVLDMKDEFGLNYKNANPEFAKNAGTAGVANVKALLDTLRAHNPGDRAHCRIQGLRHGARESAVDDSPRRQLSLARPQEHRLGEPVSS